MNAVEVQERVKPDDIDLARKPRVTILNKASNVLQALVALYASLRLADGRLAPLEILANSGLGTSVTGAEGLHSSASMPPRAPRTEAPGV